MKTTDTSTYTNGFPLRDPVEHNKCSYANFSEPQFEFSIRMFLTLLTVALVSFCIFTQHLFLAINFSYES